MKRADKALKIGKMLDELYPTTPVPLNHSSAYTLLVAVMLSAQTTFIVFDAGKVYLQFCGMTMRFSASS